MSISQYNHTLIIILISASFMSKTHITMHY